MLFFHCILKSKLKADLHYCNVKQTHMTFSHFNTTPVDVLHIKLKVLFFCIWYTLCMYLFLCSAKHEILIK